MTIDLSLIEGCFEAVDGTVLTGVAGPDVSIVVPDGAVVGLRDISLVVPGDECAGITCLGDATLVLEGANAVKAHHGEYPAVFPAEGKTLVIRGRGSLQASAGGKAAGIGGGYQRACGSIHIKNGVIVAWGGYLSAGIGSGYQRACGDITIEGSVVIATGGMGAAAIGGGYCGKCGNITISKKVVQVTASRISTGDIPSDCIGKGAGGRCGTIDIHPDANVICQE